MARVAVAPGLVHAVLEHEGFVGVQPVRREQRAREGQLAERMAGITCRECDDSAGPGTDQYAQATKESLTRLWSEWP